MGAAPSPLGTQDAPAALPELPGGGRIHGPARPQPGPGRLRPGAYFTMYASRYRLISAGVRTRRSSGGTPMARVIKAGSTPIIRA